MSDDNPEETFGYVAGRLSEYQLAYLHLVNPAIAALEKGTAPEPRAMRMIDLIRRKYRGLLMLAGRPAEAGRAEARGAARATSRRSARPAAWRATWPAAWRTAREAAWESSETTSSGWAATSICLGGRRIDVVGIEAELVVNLPLLGIAENVIRFGNSLKFLFGTFVSWIDVRMILSRQLAKRLADLLRRGVLLYAEDGVIIFGCSWHIQFNEKGRLRAP